MWMQLLASIIGVFLFYMGISILQRDNVDLKKKNTIIPIICIVVACFFLQPQNKILYGMYVILYTYFAIVGFIDYHTKKIYSIFHYPIIIMTVGYYIYLWKMGYSYTYFITVIIYILAFKILDKLKLFGSGDADLFMIVTCYLVPLDYELLPAILVLIVIILANFILIISNLKKFDWKHLKFKEIVPYAPSIVFATGIIILLFV